MHSTKGVFQVLLLKKNMEQALLEHYVNDNLFTKIFFPLKDPRRKTKGNFLYPLPEIMFLCISAILSGVTEWTEIEEFGKSKLPWLRKFFKYEYGTPSHDVLGKLFARLDPDEFGSCFVDWVNSISKLTDGEVIAFDGKSIKGSKNSTTGKACFHVVSAYATNNKICLGQVAVHEKSNEITAIPELLDLIAIKGCIVTIDAMGCQKQIAKKIRRKGADYLLMVKDNQKELNEQIKTVFKLTKPSSTHRDLDCGHGRIETRVCDVIEDLRFLDEKEQWPDLRIIVRVSSIRYNKQTKKEEVFKRYYIGSLLKDASEINKDIRSHWAVENNLHWNLDVIFGEDNQQKKKDNSPVNFNIMSKIALAMLEKKKTTKLSKNRMRLRAALDDAYREQLMGC